MGIGSLIMRLGFVLCLCLGFVSICSCSNPYYPSPWSFYGKVEFKTLDESYIVRGYFDGINYREDDHNVGSYTQIVYVNKHSYSMQVSRNMTPTSCRVIPYPKTLFSPTMFLNSTFVGQKKISGELCDEYTGLWNGIQYAMCHVPYDEEYYGPTGANGYMIYFGTKYGIPTPTIPVEYYIYDFRSGVEAESLVNANDFVVPSICTSGN